MRDELLTEKDKAVAKLALAVGDIVEHALNALDEDKKARVTEWLATGERDLLITVKVSTSPMIVVGTLTSPTGRDPAQPLFRIETLGARPVTETLH